MERSLVLLVLVGAFAPVGFASEPQVAAEPFEFREISFCEDDGNSPRPGGPGKLVAERLDDRVVVTGWASFTCGVKPTNPEVIPDWSSITLRLTSERTDIGNYCFCTAKFQFLLRKNVPSGRMLYLVKDGRGHAHTVVP